VTGVTFETVLAPAREYLDLRPREDRFVIASLAVAVSAALTDEEPLWVMGIAPPGAGKTEAIRLLDKVADKRVDELTRAGLLSWAPGKKAKRVGLLYRLPNPALVTVSDFSTVVTTGDREARARMYGMLRVVYDGHVYRGIAGEAAGEGDELEWSGHLTLLAGATSAIDAHTSFEGALGERWLQLRLEESTAQRSRDRARFVTERKKVAEHRTAAQEAALELVIEARTRIPAALPTADVDRLIDVATFVAHARTGIQFEGTGRGRVIIGVPTPEEPTRLIGQLSRLARCAIAVGLPETDALDLAISAGLDSVPLARMRALRAVADRDKATVSDVHRALKRGSRWQALWEIDALTAIGLVKIEGPTRDEDPDGERHYRLADEWRPLYTSVALPYSSPLNTEGVRGSGLRIDTPPSPASPPLRNTSRRSPTSHQTSHTATHAPTYPAQPNSSTTSTHADSPSTPSPKQQTSAKTTSPPSSQPTSHDHRTDLPRPLLSSRCPYFGNAAGPCRSLSLVRSGPWRCRTRCARPLWSRRVNARKASRPEPSRLSLTAEEASASLGLGKSAFYEHVSPNVRVVRVGSRRLYPVAELQKWLDRNAAYQDDAQ
jgi:hypothetical protein